MNVKLDFYYIVYEILDALWRRRYLFCVIIVLMPICAFLVASVMPKKYEATTSILVYEGALLNPFLKDLAYSTELKKRITGLNVFINSQEVLEKVAINSGLADKNTSPEAMRTIVDALAKSLSIKLLGASVVSIKLNSNTPHSMVDILTHVRQLFIARLLAPQISSIASSQKFLEQQIFKQSKRLSAAEKDLAVYKKEHTEHLPSNSKIYTQQLNDIMSKLNENETYLAGAEAEVDTIKENLLNSNPLVGQIEIQLIDSKAKYQLMLLRYTNEHSEIKKIIRKIERLEEQKLRIVGELEKLTKQNVKHYWDIAITTATQLSNQQFQPLLIEQLKTLQSANSKVKRINHETEILRTQAKTIRAKISTISLYERKLNELEREVSVNQELFKKLKKRMAMASVTGDLGKFEQDNLVKVIEYPRTPSKPINKPMIIFIIAGLIGGIVMASGLVVLFEFLDSTVRQARVVEQYTGVPVLCRLPKLTQN